MANDLYELRYQGSLELDEATFDRLSPVPVASTLRCTRVRI